MSYFSACSITSEKTLSNFSMSILAMTPPRVSQRIGQVGLPAEYSPGQANEYTKTESTPSRLAACMV